MRVGAVVSSWASAGWLINRTLAQVLPAVKKPVAVATSRHRTLPYRSLTTVNRLQRLGAAAVCYCARSRWWLAAYKYSSKRPATCSLLYMAVR